MRRIETDGTETAGVEKENEESKAQSGGDRMSVGSLLDIKVNLSAADDEVVKVTAL